MSVCPSVLPRFPALNNLTRPLRLTMYTRALSPAGHHHTLLLLWWGTPGWGTRLGWAGLRLGWGGGGVGSGHLQQPGEGGVCGGDGRGGGVVRVSAAPHTLPQTAEVRTRLKGDSNSGGRRRRPVQRPTRVAVERRCTWSLTPWPAQAHQLHVRQRSCLLAGACSAGQPGAGPRTVQTLLSGQRWLTTRAGTLRWA